jgi:hypothetical protein
MAPSRTWLAFIDGVLADLGVSAAYRGRTVADTEAMIGLGFFTDVPLEWFAYLRAGNSKNDHLLSP